MDSSSDFLQWSGRRDREILPRDLEQRASETASRRPSKVSLKSQNDAQAAPRPPVHGGGLRPETTVRPRSLSTLKRPFSGHSTILSRTFVPASPPVDLLYAPRVSSRRILLDLRLSSPIFVGGATVEGEVHVIIDGGFSSKKSPKASNISLTCISVTIVGIERCKGRQEIFRALTSRLIGAAQRPPLSMAPQLTAENTWIIVPSSAVLPFCIDLPIKMGPPPYESKKAGIRYLASVTVEAKIGKTHRIIRRSQEIAVLSVHDRRL